MQCNLWLLKNMKSYWNVLIKFKLVAHLAGKR